MAPWKRTNRRQRRYPFGFTLIETLVIIVVMGVLAAVSAPSFIALMDSLRVDQTIVEVRTALQTTQRQAIRRSQVCSVALQVEASDDDDDDDDKDKSKGKGNGNGNGKKTKNAVTGNCLASGEPDLPDDVSVATNIVRSSPSGSSLSSFEIKYGVLGGAEFTIQGLNTTPTRDSSGKIIAFVPKRQNGKKKCIAVSSTLGLTRVGTYAGEIDPASITQTGVCTALEWNKQ